MKKHGWIVLAGILILGLLVVTPNSHALDKEAFKAEIKEEIKEELKQELKGEGGATAWIQDHIHLSGLVEFGWLCQDIDHRAGVDAQKPHDYSDLTMVDVELAIEAEVNDWVKADIVLWYEDTSFGDEDAGVSVDEAIITIGNTEEFPVYFTGGAMYVPFGALLTHFPDDPLIDVPLTLVMGETREKAALLGVEYQGFSASAYAFNGDADLREHNNHIETYGFDGNFSQDNEAGFNVLVGASWISNIAESDGLEEHFDGVELWDRVEGCAAYFHVGIAGFFVDAEYMTALSHFTVNEMTQGSGAKKAEPKVWNCEFGYNLDWGKNLEIALKCAGSAEAEALGYPENRYGIALNQEVFEGVMVSVASLYDDYEKRRDANGRDDRRTVYGQIAVQF
jgi:hypothetical protein